MYKPVLETPLHYFHGKFSGAATPADCGVVVREHSPGGLLNVRGDARQSGFSELMLEVLGYKLPETPGSWRGNEQTSSYWLGPDEWLIYLAQDQLDATTAQLSAGLSGHFSLVDVSGGYSVISLIGDNVLTVLKKSSVYDVESVTVAEVESSGHDGATGFHGAAVQTTFAKATALIARPDSTQYTLLVRRSFADYIAQWLLDAGREFGCRIECTGLSDR